MLKNMKIKNFRGIGECELTDLSTINLFVGPNNSGKSSILEALYLCALPINRSNYGSADAFNYLMNRRIRRNNVDRTRLWHNYDTSAKISIDLGFEDGKIAQLELDNELAFEVLVDNKFSIKSKLQDNIINVQKIKIQRDSKSDSKSSIVYIDTPTQYHKPTPEDEILSGNKEIEFFVNYFNNAFILDTLLTYDFRTFENKHLKDLLIDRRDKKLIKFLNETFNMQIESLSYLPINNEYVVVFLLKDSMRRIDDMGDGFRFVFLLLSLMYSLKNELFLIEELENHQHPVTFDEISYSISNFAVKNKKQLFITTHSLELIRSFLSSNEGENIRIYHLSNHNGKISVKNIDKYDAERLDELEIDIRSMNNYG